MYTAGIERVVSYAAPRLEVGVPQPCWYVVDFTVAADEPGREAEGGVGGHVRALRAPNSAPGMPARW